MKKLLALTRWQQLLIVLTPLWIMILLGLIPGSGDRIRGAMYDLIVFIPFFSFGWQYYLGTGFLKAANTQSIPFRINALIPFVCWGLFMLWASVDLFKVLFGGTYMARQQGDPEVAALFADTLTFLCLYSIFCLIINPYFIERRYEKIKAALQIEGIGQHEETGIQPEELKETYIRPLNLISRAILVLILSLIVGLFLVDMVSLWTS